MPISTFLNDREPANLRGLLWLALSESGVVLAGTALTDAGGGATVGYTATGTFECRIDPISAVSGGLLGGAINERSTHLVTMPISATVTTDYRVVIGARGTFEVTATREQTAELATSFEVIRVS